MRIRPHYLIQVSVVAAAAVTVGAAPAALIAPAAPQPPGIATTAMADPDNGGSYCGDFCGTYTPYGDDHPTTPALGPTWTTPVERWITPHSLSPTALPILDASGDRTDIR